MRPGSVVVDLACGPHGGNVEHSRPGRTVVTDNGVSIVGAENLPASVPVAASTAYSHNLSALLRHLMHDGWVRIDTEDEIQSGVVAINEGHIVHPTLKGESA